MSEISGRRPAGGGMRRRLLRAAMLEYVEYDARLARWVVAVGGAVAARLLWALGRRASAFGLVSKIHRAGGSDTVDRTIERTLAAWHVRERAGEPTGLASFFDSHTRAALQRDASHSIIDRPESLFGYRVMVLKRASSTERGVIVVDYSYVFPLFAALFDLPAIARRYYVVLEPSWRGLCTADILSYSLLPGPVFVETVEPRDIAFLRSVGMNFFPVPLSANWWVDHRLVRPQTEGQRDIDVSMVAAWSDVKRHWRFFKVLRDLRDRGHRLRVALVGYPLDQGRAQIEAEAQHFGVLDQITIYERLGLEEVAGILSRSRVHVLWSRKEGANRAIIEALFADVPVIVREGLSYGFHYPYINEQTGHFANEETLAETLLDVLRAPSRYHPRAWAMAHMSCQRATEILGQCLRTHALTAGEPWTEDLVVKTVHLDSQHYWDPSDRERFAADYAFLASQRRPAAV